MTIIKEGGFVVDWYGQRRKFVILNDDFKPVFLSEGSFGCNLTLLNLN